MNKAQIDNRKYMYPCVLIYNVIHLDSLTEYLKDPIHSKKLCDFDSFHVCCHIINMLVYYKNTS